MDGEDLKPEEKLALITSQLQEFTHPEVLHDAILKEKRPLVIYWGTATTGRPHCGYFVPMIKIAHFLRAGCRVKILLADVHGFLDNLKAPIELVQFRAEYYKRVIQSLLKAVGVSLDKLEFVLGSEYQYTREYRFDLDKLLTQVGSNTALHAGAEVVKQVTNPKLSGLVYPLMQALDEQYLGVDAQFGGADQRKIFMLAQDILPPIGYKIRAHLMNPMVPGLKGGKMSASEPDSKIDLLDTVKAVDKKVNKAECAPKVVKENGVISFVEYVLLPVSALKSKDGKGTFVVERREGEGEPLVYGDMQKLKEDYEADILTPQLLKSGVRIALNKLLEPVQAEFQASQEWQEIEQKAYPPAEPEKKEKKKKDKGNKSRGVAAQPDGSVDGPASKQVELGEDTGTAMQKLAINGAAQS